MLKNIINNLLFLKKNKDLEVQDLQRIQNNINHRINIEIFQNIYSDK